MSITESRFPPGLIRSAYQYEKNGQLYQVGFDLHDGRLRETGTHDELIASNGMYARAFRAQASGFLKMMNEATDTSS